VQLDLLADNNAVYVRATHTAEGQTNHLLFRITDRAEEKKLQSETDLFSYINEVWKEMPQSQQDEIFGILSEIQVIIEETFDFNALIHSVIPPVAKYIGLHNFESIRRKISLDPYVHIPEKCTAEYDDSDEKPGSRDQTYLRSDYIELIALSVLLKAMIPIWLEFCYRTKSETGKDHKEYFAYMLLSASYVPDLNPIQKLERYINVSISKIGDASLNIMINGSGTDNHPGLLLASLVVTKITMIPVNPVGSESNIVTTIYYYVRQNQDGAAPTRYANMVKAKTPTDSAGSDDSNRASNLEAYKIAHSVSMGTKVKLNVWMNDILRVANRVDPHMDIALLDEFYQQALGLENARIMPVQVTLVQFVLKRVISPLGVPLLKKRALINAIAVTQTWLWQHDFFVLSGIIGATAMVDDQVTYVGGNSSRVRITPEMTADIERLFPISVIPPGYSNKLKQINPILRSIDLINEQLSANDWELRTVPAKTKVITGYENMNRLSCPNDIKMMIAALIIQLANL
jgi:hypothetical protein